MFPYMYYELMNSHTRRTNFTATHKLWMYHQPVMLQLNVSLHVPVQTMSLVDVVYT